MKSKCSLITVSILLMTIYVFSSSNAQADVQVYDNNNQYQGIMTDMDGGGIDIFIPTLGGILRYSTDYSGWCGDELEVLFESNDCSGTPYAEGPFRFCKVKCVNGRPCLDKQ